MKMNNIKLILICFVFVSQFGKYMADDDRRSKEELADDVSGKVFHTHIIFDAMENCQLQNLNKDSLLEISWLGGIINPPCSISVTPYVSKDIPYIPFCIDIQARNITCPSTDLAQYQTKHADYSYIEGTIHCAPNMNHGQCFPDKTILTVTFASMETRHEPTLLSIKFYTIDERMQEAMSRGKCWRGWKKFGGHCYYFSTESKNWTDAEESCRALDSKLVQIESKEENEWLHEHQRRVNSWTGGIRAFHGDFVWHDDNMEDMQYTNWYFDEPNNLHGTENCMQIRGAYGGAWNDLTCSVNTQYICEKSEE